MSVLTTIKNSHIQLKEGYLIGKKTKIPDGSFTHIIFAGMGGSALSAEIIKDYVGGDIQLDIVRDYHVPNGMILDKTLFVGCSYSGNTEETIACFHDARRKELPIVLMSHGGLLEEIAEENGIPFYKIPQNEQPRTSISYGLGVLMGIMEQIGIEGCAECFIDDAHTFIDMRADAIEEEAKSLAKNLKNKVPIIYSGSNKKALAKLLKVYFNENSKIQSFFGLIPEVNHNEMVGYTQLILDPLIIFLKSQYDYERVQVRMRAMEVVLKEEQHIEVYNLQLEGGTWLTETYFVLLFSYFCSYYLAKEYGIDPLELAMVDKFKKLIA